MGAVKLPEGTGGLGEGQMKRRSTGNVSDNETTMYNTLMVGTFHHTGVKTHSLHTKVNRHINYGLQLILTDLIPLAHCFKCATLE